MGIISRKMAMAYHMSRTPEMIQHEVDYLYNADSGRYDTNHLIRMPRKRPATAPRMLRKSPQELDNMSESGLRSYHSTLTSEMQKATEHSSRPRSAKASKKGTPWGGGTYGTCWDPWQRTMNRSCVQRVGCGLNSRHDTHTQDLVASRWLSRTRWQRDDGLRDLKTTRRQMFCQ